MSADAVNGTSFDVVVLGGGPGGYVAAIRASQAGFKTALIEKEALGGICLNWGCIPTKSLLHGARFVDLVKRAHEFGVTFDNLKIDFSKAWKRSRDAADRLRRGVQALMKKNGVTVIEGTGSFVSPQRIRVEPGRQEIHARYTILATGAKPRSIPGIEIDGERVITSRHALERSDVPPSLLIVGGGAIGVEFASIYHAYGTAVTIVEMEDRIMPGEDPEISQALQRSFQKRGIRVHTSARVEKIDNNGGGVVVHLSTGEQIVVDRVLVAIGVRPNVDGLSLENAGLRLDERRMLRVNEFMQTEVPNIYAIGDVSGPPYLAHAASEEGIVAVDHIAGRRPRPLRYEDMPRVTFSNPQVASLGLTEVQAREQGYEVKVGTFPFRGIGRAVAVGDMEGFCKLVLDAKYGEVLGVHMIGADVTELLAEVGLARTVEATVDEIVATIHPHPTLSEIVREAALVARGEPLHI